MQMTDRPHVAPFSPSPAPGSVPASELPAPGSARRRQRSVAGQTADADVRLALLAAAQRQLAGSADGDIATRAVCQEAGVTQPVLYRLFGDKQGLLDSVAEAGLERYAQRKSNLEVTADPVADLRAGWDDHTAFAVDNPALYRLMFTPHPGSSSTVHQRIFALLTATLTRCAAVGALTTTPRQAAQLILPANIGLALSLIARPTLFDDPALSRRTREAVFAAVLDETGAAARERSVRDAARQLHAQLLLEDAPALEAVEVALLNRWLERLDTAR
ncbi:AcrR family transcriptional regulator [Kineococcus radiotolerans]|uniref:AcrR family transcriptional regulator n=1 Tax=Kineococcus radiotolerans TaxID=131568 RepID=A0A7W4TQM5_KINRA|nr:TetR/AcrR family transcriptional regulator [Kineococcus radiotolerans]MBB2903335.1 AcrR family transcriptional regulator [Kineococcus radiotolerans]